MDNKLWPVVAKHFPDYNYPFEDDNAPGYRSHLSTTDQKFKNILMLDWPAQSPNLNPIENVRLHIKRKKTISEHFGI